MSEKMPVQKLWCDVLVIGGGGAALRSAIEAREQGAHVIVASKKNVGLANNTYISKAIFSTTGRGDERDTFDVHLKDTVVGGRYLNDQALVEVMVRKVRSQVPFLERCGVHFMKKEGGHRLHHPPGHTYPRNVQSENRIGRDYMRPLKAHAKKIGVEFAERIFITKLFAHKGSIAAATGISEGGKFYAFSTKCIILATGGYSRIFLHNNNAPGINGDGQAMAYELGVPLKDMEFVQFYPTALGTFGSRIILYEALLFQKGARLINHYEEDLLKKYGLNDPITITRDRLARAIMNEIKETMDGEGGMVMDLNAMPESTALKLRQLLPHGSKAGERTYTVSPTTHFCMGGLVINPQTETSVPGLFAAGEVCAGMHGANRIAGNALAEVFAMGGLAGEKAARRAKEIEPPQIPVDKIAHERARLDSLLSPAGTDLSELRKRLKEVMWNRAGIIRDSRDLEMALEKVREIRHRSATASIPAHKELIRYLELQNMLLISEAVCRAALLRTESRGSHYRSDNPEENNESWVCNIIITRGEKEMTLERVPVSKGRISPDFER